MRRYGALPRFLPSLPRKRESMLSHLPYPAWMPACAGMTAVDRAFFCHSRTFFPVIAAQAGIQTARFSVFF
jgi:hypothetical protein